MQYYVSLHYLSVAHLFSKLNKKSDNAIFVSLRINSAFIKVLFSNDRYEQSFKSQQFLKTKYKT